MVKYVIFDFDGTLADSKKAFISSWNTLAEKYNYQEVKFEDIEPMKNLSLKERGKQLNFPMIKVPFVLPKLYKIYRKMIHEINLFDGIKDMLAAVDKKGYKSIIISSNSKENIELLLAANKIDSISSIICSSRIFGKDKLIRRFLRENRLNPSEVIYVGDEQRDIIACKKAGVKIIWVGWGYDSIDLVKDLKPDYKVKTPAEILKLI